MLDKFKKFLHRKKDEDEPELEEPENQLKESGDINFEDIENPEDRAKSLRKKTIVGICVGVAALACATVVSNAFFAGGSSTPQQKDKPLSSAVAVNGPGQNLPDKYSDIGKYQKNSADPNDPAAKNNGQQNLNSNQPQRQTYSSASPRSTATYVPTTYESSPPRYSQPNYSNYSNDSQDRTEAQTAREEAKRAQEIINSSLAFKIAADVAQGNVAEAAQTASTTPQNLQQPSYRYSDENIPESSNYVLYAGTVVQATLLTGITSDIPNGDVVAQVRQDIYDSLTGTHLLIPQGSKLIGSYGSSSGRGNKRISVTFKRVILPTGASLTLPDQKAIDGAGYPGLSDIYNDHRGKVYSTAFKTALLGALAQSTTGNTSGDDTRSPGQEAVSGAVASILQTGQRIVEKDLENQETVEVRPGFQFSVFINQDLLIGEYIDF